MNTRIANILLQEYRGLALNRLCELETALTQAIATSDDITAVFNKFRTARDLKRKLMDSRVKVTEKLAIAMLRDEVTEDMIEFDEQKVVKLLDTEQQLMHTIRSLGLKTPSAARVAGLVEEIEIYIRENGCTAGVAIERNIEHLKKALA